MATYNTAFGALPGYKEMFGREPGQFQQQQPQQQNQWSQQGQQANQTFSQLQQQGMARPAPPQAPQGQQYQQWGGSQQGQQARNQMFQSLQQQLAQPTRFDTDMFNQIRGAQGQQIQSQFDAQRQLLDEEMARRGISASSITSGRYGDLLGQQARALTDMDAQLMMAAAQTQSQDRLNALTAGQNFADLAGSQDLAQFEANRVAQAQQFQEAMESAGFTQGQFERGGDAALRAAQAAQQGEQTQFQNELNRLLGLGGLDIQAASLGLQAGEATGQIGGQQTLSASQQELDRQRLEEEKRQFDIAQQLRETLGVGELDLERDRFQVQQEQFNAELEEQRAERMQRLDISMRDLDVRAEQIANEYEQRGEEIGLRRIRDEAEIAMALDKLAQEANLAGRGFDIEEERLRLQNEQFGRRMEEDIRQFGLSFGLQEEEVELRREQIQNEERLRGREIDVAEARQRAEEELGGARLAQDRDQFQETQRRLTLLDLAEQTGFVHQFDENGNIVKTNQMLNANDQARLNRELQTSLQETELRFRERADLMTQAIRMSEASGIMHQVGPEGEIVPVMGPDGQPQQTSAERLELARQALVTSEGNAERTAREGIQRSVNEANKEIAIMRQQIDLGQQTGTMWEIGPDGQLRDTGVQTSPQKLAEKSQALNEMVQKSNIAGVIFDPTTGRFTSDETADIKSARLDRQLRERLGMTDVVGFVYDPNTGTFNEQKTVGRSAAEASAQLANNQFIMAMMTALGALSQAEINRFLANLRGDKEIKVDDTDPKGGAPSNPGGAPEGPGTEVGEIRTGTDGKQYRWDGSRWVVHTPTVDDGGTGDGDSGDGQTIGGGGDGDDGEPDPEPERRRLQSNHNPNAKVGDMEGPFADGSYFVYLGNGWWEETDGPS